MAEAISRRLRKRGRRGRPRGDPARIARGRGRSRARRARGPPAARAPNDGVVALLTATAPPSGAGLLVEISNKGLVLDASVGKGARGELARFRPGGGPTDHEVTLDPGRDRAALRADRRESRALCRGARQAPEWAGRGGRVRGADVRNTVDDDSSEDIYLFFDAIGRRDAGDVLGRLERLFSGRAVTMGERDVESEEDNWPFYFLALLTSELRRMLLIRSTLDQTGERFDPGMSFAAFQARLGSPAGDSGRPLRSLSLRGEGGRVSPFLWYKVAQRSAAFSDAGARPRALPRRRGRRSPENVESASGDPLRVSRRSRRREMKFRAAPIRYRRLGPTHDRSLGSCRPGDGRFAGDWPRRRRRSSRGREPASPSATSVTGGAAELVGDLRSAGGEAMAVSGDVAQNGSGARPRRGSRPAPGAGWTSS